MASSVATEPQWLSDRRRRGAELVETLPLPDRKTKGWEFTDLKKLDLDAFEPARADAEIEGGNDDVVVLPGARSVDPGVVTRWEVHLPGDSRALFVWGLLQRVSGPG